MYATPYLAAAIGGLYVAGTDGRALIEEFGGASSLVFFGLNPPWSFAALAAVTVATLGGSILFVRKSLAKTRRRPKPVRPGVSYVPPD